MANTQKNADESREQVIASCDFLRDLSDESRKSLAPSLQEVRLRKNQPLFSRGDSADGMYFVVYGAMEISISAADGKKIILSILPPGTSFGEIGILDKGERTADAIAVENSHLLKLDNADFLKAAQKFTAEEWIKFSQRLCVLLRKVNYNLETLCLTNAETRLVSKLFELGRNGLDEESGKIMLKISQSQLAEMVNLTRETANKILSQMEKKGLIKLNYGKIEIVNLAGLCLYGEKDGHS